MCVVVGIGDTACDNRRLLDPGMGSRYTTSLSICRVARSRLEHVSHLQRDSDTIRVGFRKPLRENDGNPASIFPTKPCSRPTGTARREHSTWLEVPSVYRHPERAQRQANPDSFIAND